MSLPKPWLYRQKNLIILLLSTLLSALIIWQVAYWTQQVARDDIRLSSQQKLNLVVSNINTELQRYRVQPRLISANPSLIPVLLGTTSEQAIQTLNADLQRINEIIGASDIYLLRANGDTVAASNYQQEKTFIGKNFKFRPYFTLAMQDKSGQYFAYGITSNKRGYFFSYPVRHQSIIIGVVTVKISVEQLEQQWQVPNDQILVIDDYGVVFLASDPSWHYHAMTPLSDEDASGLRQSLQYGKKALKPMPIVAQAYDEKNRMRSLTIERGAIVSDTRDYIVEQLAMPAQGWRVLLLTRDEKVAVQVQSAVIVAALVIASVLLIAINIAQRRRRLVERMALKDAHSLELEQKVKNRTKALTQTNELLEDEVVERKQAEEALRGMQAGLVQATKLAALGKMSAGVSHELNQPLAAIRSYSDNAKAFIKRGNLDTASDNLQSITELADRMDRIIKNLRTYARDESISMRPVVVADVWADSLSLLEVRISQESIEVINEIATPSPVVIAGDVRLQQVFVNILSNAFDSMRNSALKQLRICAQASDEDVTICISDTGTGVPKALREHVFDPFYSTKSVGEGMGLGLSITYGIVDQFGGRIVIGESASGGAMFTIILKKSN